MNISAETTKFHGVTYDEAKDKKRFSSQLLRIADVLSSGQEYDSQSLCMLASVSFSALRNRISDLRVYHAFKIEAKRVKNGLWKYRFLGRMTTDEHEKYLKSLRKLKPIGDKELFGEMLRTIYAYAHQGDLVNLADLETAAINWAKDLSTKVTITKG